MQMNRLLALGLCALAAGLAGCEWWLPPEPTVAPPPPPAPARHEVRIEFEDTGGAHNAIHPHATIVSGEWAGPGCPAEAPVVPCTDALPPLRLNLLNDGNADITRVHGSVEVWDRVGARVVVLPWLRETFREKGGEVNVWQVRETVAVTLDVAALCAEPGAAACAAEHFAPANVSRVFVRLEAVELSSL